MREAVLYNGFICENTNLNKSQRAELLLSILPRAETENLSGGIGAERYEGRCHRLCTLVTLSLLSTQLVARGR